MDDETFDLLVRMSIQSLPVDYWDDISDVSIFVSPKMRVFPSFLRFLHSEKIKTFETNLPLDRSLAHLIGVLDRMQTCAMHSLSLAGMDLTDRFANMLPFQFIHSEIHDIDLRDNPRLTMIPGPIGYLPSENVKSLRISEDNLQILDQKYVKEANVTGDFGKLFSYLRLAWEGTSVPINEIKLILIGASHAGKSTFRQWLETGSVAPVLRTGSTSCPFHRGAASC